MEFKPRERNCKNCYMTEMKGECKEIGYVRQAILNGRCEHHKFIGEFLNLYDEEPRKYYAC